MSEKLPDGTKIIRKTIRKEKVDSGAMKDTIKKTTKNN